MKVFVDREDVGIYNVIVVFDEWLYLKEKLIQAYFEDLLDD